MKPRHFHLPTAIFVVLMSVSSANAQLLELGGKWLLNEYAKNKEISEKTQEIYPTYNDWIKFLEDYIKKTGKVGDCNAIGFRDLSSNRGETKYFSYECGIDGDVAFLNAKTKVKIGKCDEGSVFKAEFDIGKNYLDTRSFPRNDACVFFQPSCRALISGSCPSNMVFVGGETFAMGCKRSGLETCDGNNEPLHMVTLSDFCIGKYEVTQREWQEIMGSNPSNFKNCGNNCPVEQVSWNDIQEFIRKLNAKTRMNYRLPTEAEWEYAARGGCHSKNYLYSGSNNLDNVAWYGKNSRGTHTVGTKQQNELGIYDMSGNVWEWVNDWYASGYSNSHVSNPKGPNNGSKRVIRGGSWKGAAFSIYTHRSCTVLY